MSTTSGGGDDFELPPMQVSNDPVESVVSVHDQEQPETQSQLGQVEWISFYCFTDYIEAIPLSADVAGGDLDGDQLEDFPELPAIQDYAMLYCLDCVTEQHARAIAHQTAWVQLDHQTVTDEEIATRQAVLAELLQEDHMAYLHVLVGPENQDFFFEIFQRHGGNRWNKIEIRRPDDGVDATRIDTQIEGNLANDVFYTILSRSPSEGAGINTPVRLPQQITQQEINWLEEFVSFNHIRDVGNDGPPPDDAPVTPPVPIFPSDQFLETVVDFPQDEYAARTVYTTAQGVTERFEFNEPGYWIHQGTGFFTIPYGNCWVDQDHHVYRMYADNVAEPQTIGFFQLDDDFVDIPPQAPNFAMRTGFNLPGDIEPWGRDEQVEIAVFG